MRRSEIRLWFSARVGIWTVGWGCWDLERRDFLRAGEREYRNEGGGNWHVHATLSRFTEPSIKAAAELLLPPGMVTRPTIDFHSNRKNLNKKGKKIFQDIIFKRMYV